LEVGESAMEMENAEVTQLIGFSGDRWSPEKDIKVFGSILFEFVCGGPPQGELSIHRGIPSSVSRIIKSGLSPISRASFSFNTVLDILEQNNFETEDGVD
jgi:hypothetical protein